MTDTVSFSDAQLQKILSVLETAKSGGIHWEQVIPVFLSAALGMSVGIGLEYFKASRERKKASSEQAKRELNQINLGTIGLAYNIETLIHLSMQNLLPHFYQSAAALQALYETNREPSKVTVFAMELYKYPALMMTSPDMHFADHDFLERLPFIVEKDAQLLQQAGWVVSLLRTLRNSLSERNKLIESARVAATQSGASGLTFYQLDSILQIQLAVSKSECVAASQLFTSYLYVARSLQTVATTYTAWGHAKTFVPPDALADAMKRLKIIADDAISEMPAVQ
jgi:hypothetical protein